MTQVSIDGVAAHATRLDARKSLPEMIFDVVSHALVDAGCTMDDIDGIVIAAHDLVDGRSLSSMITGPAAGAYLRDEIRVSDDGLVAVSLAAARVQARDSTRVVVASWGRVTEGDPERSSRSAYDPFTEQPLGLSVSVASALRAAAYLRAHGGEKRAAAGAARRARAARNARTLEAGTGLEPVAHYPLDTNEVGVPADVAAAVVLGTGAGPVIRGVGHGSEWARLGDRRLSALPGAGVAVAAALQAAGVELSRIEAVELGGETLFDEVLLLEASGLATPGNGLDVYASNAWVNPSGGSRSGDCYPCGGLLRFVDAVLQMRGEAGSAQLPVPPTAMLVAAGSAVAMQTTTAIVIEKT